MMMVSDPIMFGVVVEEFYKDVLAKYAAELKQAGFDPNNGIGDLYAKLGQLPEAQRVGIEAGSALVLRRCRMAPSVRHKTVCSVVETLN